jgi:hypothetical protein
MAQVLGAVLKKMILDHHSMKILDDIHMAEQYGKMDNKIRMAKQWDDTK